MKREKMQFDDEKGIESLHLVESNHNHYSLLTALSSNEGNSWQRYTIKLEKQFDVILTFISMELMKSSTIDDPMTHN